MPTRVTPAQPLDLAADREPPLAGRYLLERELARGGMATVYLAADLKHGRSVAVKVLPPELAAAGGAERFLREIAVTATLHHPHILALLDSGEVDGRLFYVMPLVEGESLRERLARERQLPVDDAARIAAEVASALDYAHRRGVIHRDLKPENILLQDGQAMVADFGVARAVLHAAGGDGATPLTSTGLTVGTPAYMSPEQATGERELDGRSDVFALGCVLYEMLAGRPPFAAPTAQGVVAKVLTETPRPITAERRAVPAHVGGAVMTALEKLPADRFATAAQFAAALTAPGGTSAAAAAPPPARRAGRLTTRDVAAAALGAGLVAAAAGVWVVGARRGAEVPPRPRARLTLDLPADARLNPAGAGYSMALSRDGSTLVYAGGAAERRLYVRRLPELTPRALPGTEDPSQPGFSPDGRWVGFVSGGWLKKVPVDGGQVVPLVRADGRFAWGPDGTIVFRKPERGSGLWRVSANGGAPERLTTPNGALGENHAGPIFLPDGRTVVFSAASDTGGTRLAALRLSDRKVVLLGIAGGGAQYLDGGYLVFGTAGGLPGSVSAVRFDAARLRALGEPAKVLDGVAAKPSGGMELTVAPNGTLVYLPGVIGREVVEVDRRGAARVLVPMGRGYGNPRVSPDGRRVALNVGRPPFTSDVWIHDLASGTLTPLTSDGASRSPQWTPDGRRVAWTSTALPAGSARGDPKRTLWWRPWDASTPAVKLGDGDGVQFTPDGRALVTADGGAAGTEVRVMAVAPAVTAPARVPLSSKTARELRLSPDGRWLAYVAEETGVREVYVQPFPGPGGRFRISAGGGTAPVWSRDGRELFYRRGTALVAATIAPVPEPRVVRRDTLFTEASDENFDVTPDGKRFVMVRLVGTTSTPVVVIGWGDEVRERLAPAQRQ